MTALVPQNYILYRTTALTRQPASYTDADGKTVTPSPVVISPAGTVVGVQLLTTTEGISVPDGFAFALDSSGKHPIGSIFTPSTGYALSGSSAAMVGTALTLTLTPNDDGPGADTTVTLSDGDAGGAFSADAVKFSGGMNTAQTVTYTPKVAGTITISATNNGGLADPAALSVTVGSVTTTTP